MRHLSEHTRHAHRDLLLPHSGLRTHRSALSPQYHGQFDLVQVKLNPLDPTAQECSP